MKFTIIIILIALTLSRRIRRSVGFQKYNEPMLIIRIVLFFIISLLFLAFAFLYPQAFLSDGLGIVAGLILAYIATNHAQFEKREDGIYFKTHIWVEIIVIALFLARFVYRIVVVKDMFQPDESQQDLQTKMQAMHDPITGSVLFAFCTYYIGYFYFIIKEAKKALRNNSGLTEKP